MPWTDDPKIKNKKKKKNQRHASRVVYEWYLKKKPHCRQSMKRKKEKDVEEIQERWIVMTPCSVCCQIHEESMAIELCPAYPLAAN